MNEDFIMHMNGAIANSPNSKISQQLQILLIRLQGTDGQVAVLPGVDAPEPSAE